MIFFSATANANLKCRIGLHILPYRGGVPLVEATSHSLNAPTVPSRVSV